MDVLAYLSGVDIYMYDFSVFCYLVGFGDGSVGNSCTAEDEEVTLLQSTVGVASAMGAHHTQIVGVVHWHNADTHHGGNYGDSALCNELHKFISAAGGDNTAAAADKGTLGLLNKA